MTKIKEIFNKTSAKVKEKQVLFTSTMFALIALIFGIGLFCAVEQSRHTPELDPYIVSVSVSTLYPTSVYTSSDGKSTLSAPDRLRVNFGADISFRSEADDKNLEEIKITPDLQGVWSWGSNSRLIFTPKKDWAPSQTYNITLPKNIISTSEKDNPLKLEKYEFSFSTPSFSRNLKYFNLQQDPQDPKIYKAIAEMTFTFPVEPEDFEKSIKLTLDKKDLKFETIYDEYKRTATILSAPVKILTTPQLAVLNLGKYNGVNAQEKVLDIPSSSKFFRFERATSQIVRNEKDDPEQVLMVSFTDSMSESALNGKVKAYLLPEKNANKKNRKGGTYTRQVPCENDCYCDEEDDEDCSCEPSEEMCEETVNVNNSSDEWIASDITPEVLAKLPAIKLEALPTASEYEKLHSFKYNAGDFDETRYLYVKISAPLTSSSGFEIKENNDAVIRLPAYPKEVKIVGGGSLIALGGSKKLSFVSRGVDTIKVELARILPGKINHFVSQTGGSFEDPYFRDSYYFNESDISEAFEETISLKKDAQKANYSSLDLDQYLKSGKTGLFLIKAYGKSKYSSTSRNSRFLLVTNLGILTKKDIDDNTRVYVMNINTGYPVESARVDVLGRNGIPLFTKYTNFQGYADFPSLNDFSNEKRPVAFTATLGEDVSFIPVSSSGRDVNYSRFDTGGVYYSSYRDKGLSAFLFTDRGLYRPGDTANIAAIVKTPDWKSLAGVPVKISIVNPKSKTVFERKVSLNEQGFVDFNFDTEPTYPTGEYKAYFYDVTNVKYPVSLGNTTFRVEEFQEDKLRITANLLGGDKKGWQPLEGLSAQVKLENLYGTPAKGNRVRAELSLSPVSFYFSKYKDYTFDDPYRNDSASYQSARETLPTQNTDDAGMVKHALDLKKYAGGTYKITFSAEGFEEESGSSVYSYDTLLVSPNRYLAGYKSASNLNFLKRNTEAALDFIAVDADLNQIELSKLKARLVRIQYVSTLIKQYNGTYKYQSVVKENEVESKPFVISKKGSSLALSTKEPGQYAYEIYDEFNQKLSRVKFFVTGSANLSYSLEKDAELTVTLDREEVEPGSDIFLNIITPYTGSGLITIEREKVFAQKWFSASSTSTQQSIRVPSDFEGNGYINVSFIRGIDSKDVFMAPHSYAVVPFTVKKNKRMVNITLDAPQLVKPGDELNIKYSSDKNAKIVLYGVNQGILQVASYKLPKPLEHFFKKMALEVKTRQILDLILPDFKIVRDLASTGGDDEYAFSALEEGLNPFARKRDKPVVFWSGVMDASTTERTYTYKVPSYFNGELKIMAVAASSEATGSNSMSTLVRAPIIMMAGNPYVAAPGDVFDASMRVANNKKDSDGKIDLDVKVSEHLEIIGDKKMSLNIPYGSSQTVKFKVRALEKLGSASIRYTAININPKDIVNAEATLSVRPATVYSTVLTTGSTTDKKFEIKNFQRDMFAFGAERTMFISNSPLVLAKGLATYFSKYPHGCTEQITSQVFPFLGLATLGGKESIIKREDMDHAFNILQERLRRRQLNYGGFGLWDSSYSENKDVTLYAMHMLIDAKDMGYNVDAGILANGIKRLDDYASKYPTSTSEAYENVFAAYLLARSGKVVTNYLSRSEEYLNKNVKDWQSTLTGAYMGATYMLLKDESKARTLINAFKAEGRKYMFYSDYDSSSIRNAKYVYLIGRHFPELMDKNAEIIKTLIGAVIENNYNTMSSAQTIMALTAYAATAQGKDNLIKVNALSGKTSTPVALKEDGFPKGEFGADVDTLSVEAEDIGTLGLYYIVSTQGFDKKPQDSSLSKGLDIVREYLGADGKPAKEFTIGDDITVSIKLKTSGSTGYMNNIAITDLLPGAFEIVSGSINGNTDFYDMREDRALIYTSASKDIKEITYKVKVIASGDYTTPMLHAAAMYDKEVYGYVKAGKITVKPIN